jgi:cyclopropane fatty-acyl-phospholipid synthase-like methyltransferase
MININTKENWDKYHSVHGASLNYPEKFKFISRELLTGFPNNAKILEMGCGMGFLLKQIKQDHPKFHLEGMEFSKVAVDYVNSLGLSAKEGTVPIDLKNYSGYNAIIATEFLEHLEEKNRLETLKEVYRMLKKGGKAIFTVPDNILPPSEEKFHLVCYTKETFKTFLLQIFNFTSVISRKFLVSDKPSPVKGVEWGEAPFLFGIGYK